MIKSLVVHFGHRHLPKFEPGPENRQNEQMVTSFQAFGVFLFALLPGASYLFAFERQAGSFGITFSDRLVRFLAASAFFQALLSGLTYTAYRHYVESGRPHHERPSAWLIELVALGYVGVPVIAGHLIGLARRKTGRRWAWARWFASDAPEPRAWDFLWRREPQAVVRIHLKSDRWIAGLFGTHLGRRSYASAYPEPGDIYLSWGVEIDACTGELSRNASGQPILLAGGILVAATDIEYCEVVE